jgi:hypothetical protein
MQGDLGRKNFTKQVLIENKLRGMIRPRWTGPVNTFLHMLPGAMGRRPGLGHRPLGPRT